MAYLCKVEICGVDTSKLPVLNSEQMLQLFQQYQNGESFAREQLIYSNLRLVLSVIQRFSNRNENADDLFQVGCIGLMKAIDNFNLQYEVKFSTYAVPMTYSCRETDKEEIMTTRKQALQSALTLLDGCPFEDVEVIKMKLQELENALPVLRWNQADILDRLDQYVEEHGKPPSAHALQRKGLPTKRLVEDRFQMEYYIFLSEYYGKRLPQLTRKVALEKTVIYLTGLHDTSLEDTICVLSDLLNRIPITTWDLPSALDAIDEFYLKHGRYPFSKDFKGYTLPAHGVMKLRFDMYPQEFMELYYPGSQSVWQRTLHNYEYKSREEWLDAFREFLQENPNVRSKTYGKLRSKEMPALYTMFKIAGVASWNDLLVEAGLPVRFIPGVGKLRSDKDELTLVNVTIKKELPELEVVNRSLEKYVISVDI